MARFTLVVRPDGKAILTCQEAISPSTAAAIRDAFDEWREDKALLIVAECDVVQVVDIELALPEPAGVA